MKTKQMLVIECDNDTEYIADKNWIETALNEYCKMINHKAKFKVYSPLLEVKGTAKDFINELTK